MARSKLPNIDDLSIADLNLLIERAKEQIAAKKDEAKSATMAELKAFAASKGFSLEELMGKGAGGRRQRSDKGVKLKPKFEGPNGETYTGRGPTPKWLRDLEAKGHKRDRYLVK
jgi:DNA-binding protein H-NS